MRKVLANATPVLLLLLWLSMLNPMTAAEPVALAGKFSVETTRVEWQDATRKRTVPAKIYYPRNVKGSFPLIVFSHGLGGSRDGYEYVGRHWASHGFLCVHLQHPGSDSGVWRGQSQAMGAMRAAAADPRNALDRAKDVTLGITEVFHLNEREGPLKGLVDTNQVGMAGHSFGSHTTVTVVGQELGFLGTRHRDPRIKAAIAMSSPVPARITERSYRGIQVPIYHLTGTKDDSPIGNTPPEQRRIPFDRIQGNDQYLLTLNGGDHMVFSGYSGTKGARENDALFHDLILASTTAFWQAYLKNEAKPRSWLQGGGFQQTLGTNGVWEQKIKKP